MNKAWRVMALMILALSLATWGRAAELKVGDKAPGFSLMDQNRQMVSLSDFLGKKNVVLAFYVLAFTGG
jgi:peroxiredoxin